MHAYIHTYISIYIHTYIHTYIHCVCVCVEQEDIKKLTVGPENTVCALTLRRHDKLLTVHLVRHACLVEHK